MDSAAKGPLVADQKVEACRAKGATDDEHVYLPNLPSCICLLLGASGYCDIDAEGE
jgi:hypothetical protein